VSLVRAEAIVVTTEDDVGGIIEVAVDVATAVTVVTSQKQRRPQDFFKKYNSGK